MSKKPPNLIHLDKLLGDYRSQWVALDDELTKVVASGDTIGTAIDAAEKRGYPVPIVIWAPASLEGFSL